MYGSDFTPPPECPVFEPNEEEFADPLAYINKIRPIAELSGICKIRPPPHWQPPFAIDVENFRFTPRIQRINELGIHTRLRLQFNEKLSKFWRLQGYSFKLPHVGGKPLDLYGLHDIVKNLGGYQNVSNNKQWTNVCSKLGLNKSFSGIIHKHYDKYLLPFDLMKSGLAVKALEDEEKRETMMSLLKTNSKRKKSSMYKGGDLDWNLDLLAMTSAGQTMKPRKQRKPAEPLVGDIANNKELAKLQIFGSAGPKLVGLGVVQQKEDTALKVEPKLQPSDVVEPAENNNGINYQDVKKEVVETESRETNSDSQLTTDAKDDQKLKEKQQTSPVVQTRHRNKPDQVPYSMIDSMDNCKVCGKDSDVNLLMCDACDDNYHTYCLIPPLSTPPTGDWRCPKCIAKECNKQSQAYGFEQARKEYTLHSFGEMADAFKSEYFSKPTHGVTSEEVEKEFWRLVGSLEEDLTVEYGADIHVIKHGSGFPRINDNNAITRGFSKEEEEYARSGWNLNNLPVLEHSLLRTISGDISGMKVPWVYVGMCFSAFCWHIEDHWTYSINYLHWGEPKTWYGIPRSDAEKFETVMKNSAPELFKNHPDLLHHLVTTMNPTTLMQNGVNVVRTNQCAGEFMVTFPRAYHAGFNQGYNFAEAVNFCPADWVPIGRQCIEHYRNLHKCCVFSHEEILCKMAQSADNLEAELAVIVYEEFKLMIETEQQLRDATAKMGVVNTSSEAFECVPDDERQCAFCSTTVFLSALSCTCQGDKLVCLYHIEELCDKCPPEKMTLRYRYRMEEFSLILDKLQGRACVLANWKKKVHPILKKKLHPKPTVEDIKVLINEAEREGFQDSEELKRLKNLVQEASVCTKVAEKLLTTWNHDMSREPPVSHAAETLLEFKEMLDFQEQLRDLACRLDLCEKVEHYISHVQKYNDSVISALKQQEPRSDELTDLLHKSKEFFIALPNVMKLKKAFKCSRWREEVRSTIGFHILDKDKVDFPTRINDEEPLVSIEELKILVDKGMNLLGDPDVEATMKELRRLITMSEAWEKNCTTVLTVSGSSDCSEASKLINSSRELPVHLPSSKMLHAKVLEAQKWEEHAKAISEKQFYPYLHELEALCTSAKQIPFRMDFVEPFEFRLRMAKNWLDTTVSKFGKKGDDSQLIQILTPRVDQANSVLSIEDSSPNKSTAAEAVVTDDDDSNSSYSSSVDSVEDEAVKSSTRVTLDTDMVNRQLTDIIDSYFRAEKTEIALMKKKRAENDQKMERHKKLNKSFNSENDDSQRSDASSTETDKILYCICRKPNSGFMLQCELCHEWFHQHCISLPKFCSGRNKSGTQITEMKFLCPMCQRSKRPTLTEVLKLLLELQKIPVRIREGEALQFLTERAIRWQKKARGVIYSSECKSIMDHLSASIPKFNGGSPPYNNGSLSPRSATFNDNSSNEKTPSKRRTSIDVSADESATKITSSPNHKQQSPTSNTSPTPSSNHAATTVLDDESSSEDKSSKIEAAEALMFLGASPTPTSSSNTPTATTEQNERNSSPDLECYEKIDSSTPTKNESNLDLDASDISNIREDSHNNKSKAKDMEDDGTVVLEEETKQKLEELMFEGDLIEICLAESTLIWKILVFANNPKKNEDFTNESADDDAEETTNMEATIRPDYLITSSAAIDDTSTTAAAISTSNSSVKSSSSDKKKRKSSVNGEPKRKKRRSSQQDSSTDRSKEKTEKKRRKREEKQALISRAKAATSSSSTVGDDDENASCSAKRGDGTSICRQPTGDTVSWVQCDGACQDWFHCFCVGISPQEAAQASTYRCEMCR